MQKNSFTKLSIAALVVVTSGCATEVISSNSRSVIINHTPKNIAEGAKLADAECKKYDSSRVAKISHEVTLHAYAYDCVPK